MGATGLKVGVMELVTVMVVCAESTQPQELVALMYRLLLTLGRLRDSGILVADKPVAGVQEYIGILIRECDRPIY